MVTCSNMSLTRLVSLAHQINYNQIAAPDWMATQNFEITARIPRGTTKDQYAAMWQRLLTDRFQLAAHRQEKEVAQYDLVAAKSGPKFIANEDPPPSGDVPALGSHPPMKVDKNGFPELARPGMIGMNDRITLYQTKMTMPQLASTLSGQMGKPVTDKTGLTGSYDIRMHWVVEGGRSAAPGPDSAAPLPAAPEGGPTLGQALQDQLGLRLEAKRGMVEFLVVDHCEKLPTEN
jgi:uncharacterized protein (TIGR03435 family)